MDQYFQNQFNLLPPEVVAILKTTLFAVPTWKWTLLLLALVIGFLTRPLVQFILKNFKTRIPLVQKHPESFLSSFLKLNIEKPAAGLVIVFFWFAVGESLGLGEKIGTYFNHVLLILFAFFVIQLLLFAVDAASVVLSELAKKSDHTAFDDQLVPFAAKSAKTLVIVLIILLALQNMGLNVVSLLAGLGLGGLALALAAQDTAANLFGSITILADNPFTVGDWVKIKDLEGTVEEIGFRSTRIRTFYNSVVTVPNAMMAKETIDNMGVRPLRRIRQVLGLTYETSPEKIEEFCSSVRYLLKQHGKVQPDSITVTFNNFSASSLDVLVNFHIHVTSGEEEVQTQQALLLEILKIAHQLQVDFAYPTQTVYNKN